MDDAGPYEHHIPDINDDSLSVDESAYTLLEQISLEWPTQTVCFIEKDILLVGTNPSDEFKGQAAIMALDFSRCSDYSDLNKFLPKRIYDTYVNRIRCPSSQDGRFSCVSDNEILIFMNNELIYQKGYEMVDYGLAMDNERACYAHDDGFIDILSLHNLDIMNKEPVKIHEKSINDICINQNTLYTCSNDGKMKAIDLRSNDKIIDLQFDCDVNSIDFNNNSSILIGLDNGEIHVHDVRSEGSQRTIKWHKTPISSVKFSSESEFSATSREKTCLYDLDLEEIEDWDYPNELLFEHSGDRDYKDVDFNTKGEDCVFAVCGEKGIGLFSPISE